MLYSMGMDKFSFIALWDIYRGLLTDTRREITDMYLNLDLTVSEIAFEKGISRQAVSDCLKGCKEQLEGYENKLHICGKLRKRKREESLRIAEAGKWAENFKSAYGYDEDIRKLEDILTADYSADAEDISDED